MKKILTTIVLSSMLLSIAGIAEAAPKKDIAIQLYSLRDMIKKDYPNTIKLVGKMGYTAVEAAGYSNGKFYGKTPEQFKSDVEAAGMRVLSSHVMRPLTKEEIESKDFSAALKFWDEAIAAHKAAGMEYIVVPYQKVPATIAELKTHSDYFNAIAKKCKAAGLKFGYHNHAHEFQKVEDKVVMMDYLIENSNPDEMFIELDVYWVVKAGLAPVEYFKKYPKRFKLLHIKDLKELGESGMVGFDAIFKHIAISGAENIVVEVERYDYAPEKSVEMSYQYLQNASFVPNKL